jgi:hypothetical protein
MKLTFLGVESDVNGCPTLYATDRGTFVVQGWKITDAEVLAQVRDLPDHEDVVEIPRALVEHFLKQV